MDESAASVVDDVLTRLSTATRDRDAAGMLAVFSDDPTLYGSGADEFATGSEGMRSFATDVMTWPVTVGWTWQVQTAGRRGDVIWFVAPGQVELGLDDGTFDVRPYRLSGVIGLHGDTWLIEVFNGSEPAADEQD